MLHHKLATFGWSLAILMGALFVAPALASEKAENLKTGEEAILAALDEKTCIEFIDEPLSGVVQYLKSSHHIEILIDTKALEDVSIGADTLVSKSIQNVKFRSALNLILHDLGLAWVVADEVLMITTPEEAEMHLTTRVYDVTELVAVRDLEGEPWQDFDSLIRAVTGAIDPESWGDVGGPGSIAELEYRGASVLIVRQTLDCHAQVRKLLDDLATVADGYGDDVVPTREKAKPEPVGAGAPGTAGFGGTGGGGGQF